jgi:hypothetical protein
MVSVELYLNVVNSGNEQGILVEGGFALMCVMARELS